MAETGEWMEPLRGYQFAIELGEDRAYFTQCSGIGARVQPIRFRAGGMRETVHYLSGPPSYAEMVLRYGVTQSNAFWAWFEKALAGRPHRRNISVVMLDAVGVQERVRWNLIDAWPTQMTAASMDAMGGEVAIEEMRVIYESLERSAAPAASVATGAGTPSG